MAPPKFKQGKNDIQSQDDKTAYYRMRDGKYCMFVGWGAKPNSSQIYCTFDDKDDGKVTKSHYYKLQDDRLIHTKHEEVVAWDPRLSLIKNSAQRLVKPIIESFYRRALPHIIKTPTYKSKQGPLPDRNSSSALSPNVAATRKRLLTKHKSPSTRFTTPPTPEDPAPKRRKTNDQEVLHLQRANDAMQELFLAKKTPSKARKNELATAAFDIYMNEKRTPTHDQLLEMRAYVRDWGEDCDIRLCPAYQDYMVSLRKDTSTADEESDEEDAEESSPEDQGSVKGKDKNKPTSTGLSLLITQLRDMEAGFLPQSEAFEGKPLSTSDALGLYGEDILNEWKKVLTTLDLDIFR
jgi:hypothetical protein